jgi:ketosteroid isomerase-like protein
MSGATIALAPDALVRRWVDAFHARDVEGMLAHLDPEVRFHPLRLSGLDGSYRGHDGVQRWFARLTQLHHDYVIVLSEVCGSGDDKVLAVGELRLARNLEIAPFRALHRIAEGVIVAAHHYLGDPSGGARAPRKTGNR